MKHGTRKVEALKTNYLGIDYGKKKIGIAIAPEGILAVGFLIIPNNRKTFYEIEKIIHEHDIGAVVVGLPLNMDGTASIATRSVFDFISRMKAKFPSRKIYEYDERLTSREARKNIPRKKEDDAEAARIILQGFIDRKEARKYDIL